MYMKAAKAILGEICKSHSHDVTYSEAKEALVELNDGISEKEDIWFEFDGNDYRIIHEDSIWDIYVDEIKEVVNDCYDLKLDDVPDWIALEIDWEQTAKNAYVDGYGHHFSSYDGSETDAAKHFIFRVN